MWRRVVVALDIRTLSRWLLLAGWPLHVVFASAASAAGILGVATAQPALVAGTAILAFHYVCGVHASFALHELGHAIVLQRSSGVASLILERTLWRISVSVRGSMRGRDAFLAAVAGPGVCVAVGLVLLLVCPQVMLHGWFLAHGVFLLPIFADGRAAIAGARAWHRCIGAATRPPATRRSPQSP